MPRTRPAAVVAALLAVAAVSGCGDQGILRLGADELTEPACATTRDIPADELTDAARLSCRPVGSTILFPSGDRIAISGGGGTVAAEGDDATRYAYEDVGDHGVIAARYTADCSDVETWGPDKALTKVRAAFGARWPCDPE
ncbi:hypothetical protein ITJ44_11265 [Clavibacter sp. VKM Ac-2873]|uniref:hypothetical protein n=1 Tax=Clavibacter sp. VKM Ac-2873 TaxID=2783813 RepID=UPI00188C6C4F|nr:hypothetical protein [Clavibacter sp. VKM Ac-2873]MBF4618652.1 hypothetical protein [Clavibacter sp. VKM Ac-2873]